MKSITFEEFTSISKPYLNKSKFKDGHTTILTDSRLLISAPHGVVQTRLGKEKFSEPGSARLALVLQKNLNCNLILKTKNMFDDANFDVDCPYRRELKRIIEERQIKYLIDIHGLAARRPCDVNLGINFGQSIKNDQSLYNTLVDAMQANGFVVNVDNPFCGRYPSITAAFSKEYDIWAIQIEVNCSLTYKEFNIDKLNTLIITLTSVFEKCPK